MKRQQHTQRLAAVVIIIAALAAGCLSLLLPVVSTVDNPLAAHWRTLAAVVLWAIYTGTATWFLSGLQLFRTRLRIAYILLAVGLIAFSCAMLQLPILGMLDLWDTAWSTGGGAILMFSLSAVPLYLAMSQLARTLQLQSRVTSFLLVSALALITAGMWGVFSSYAMRYELEGIAAYEAALAFGTVYVVFASFLALRIAHAIGASYQQAFRWQAWAFAVLAAGGLHEAITTLFMSPSHVFQEYGLYMWPFIVSGLVFLRACYEFRLLTAETVDEPAPAHHAVTDEDYTDSIIAVAGLASRPEDIDDILDGLRFATSHAQLRGKLSPADKRQLLTVYTQLEAYFKDQDPIRKFTTDQLRKYVTPAFRQLLQR